MMETRIRQAKASDKEPLMRFIKDVWGGHDYIPYVWDQWLNNPGGRMFVIEVEGIPVGMNRVRFLEDGSAWFEGVRVHPDYRGRGLASMLGENSMELAAKRGVRVFRLTSGSHNKSAHRQIARIRFKEIARFSVYEPPKRKRFARMKRAAKASSEDADKIMRMIEGSKEYRLGRGVFWHDYTAASLSRAVIKKLVDEGAVWTFRDAVVVTREGGGGSEIWEEYCFVGGAVEDSLTLIGLMLGWSKRAKVRWVFVPQGSPLIRGLRARGFKRNFAMVLFERRAVNG